MRSIINGVDGVDGGAGAAAAVALEIERLALAEALFLRAYGARR